MISWNSTGDPELEAIKVYAAVRKVAEKSRLRRHIPASQLGDVVHDVMLRIMDRPDPFLKVARKGGNLEAYVQKTVHNALLKELRKAKDYTELNIPLDPVLIPDETEYPHLNPGSDQFIRLRAFEAALPRLSCADQKVICLKMEGFTFREISKLLDIPIPTAKSQHQAAMRRLRKEMGE